MFEFRFKALAKGVYPIDDFNNLPDLYVKPAKKKLSKKSKQKNAKKQKTAASSAKTNWILK